jgi:hypothetical protein
VSQLAAKGRAVKILVRPSAIIPEEISDNTGIEIIYGNINDFSTDRIGDILRDCDSVISCLGHNISLKGIFGKPHWLVYNAVRKLSDVLQKSEERKKLIVMSTTAYTDKVHGEQNTFRERIVFALLKVILPPHADNVKTGNYLLENIKRSEKIEWIVVRPDSLIDETSVSDYEIVPMKNRSPLFNPGKTSRINVAHFMCDLLLNDALWQTWKYKAPVIYNKR